MGGMVGWLAFQETGGYQEASQILSLGDPQGHVWSAGREWGVEGWQCQEVRGRIIIMKYTQWLFYSKGLYSGEKRLCQSLFPVGEKKFLLLQPPPGFLYDIREKKQLTGVRVSRKYTGNIAIRERKRGWRKKSCTTRETHVKVTALRHRLTRRLRCNQKIAKCSLLSPTSQSTFFLNYSFSFLSSTKSIIAIG